LDTGSDRSCQGGARLLRQQGGWLLSNVSIQYLTGEYLTGEAQIGKILTVVVGITNLTDKSVVLDFLDNRHIIVSVYDAGGRVIYETSPGLPPTPANSVTIPPTKYTSWTERILLDNATFDTVQQYKITGQINTTFSSIASILLNIVK
jgi:hypothetical protein